MIDSILGALFGLAVVISALYLFAYLVCACGLLEPLCRWCG